METKTTDSKAKLTPAEKTTVTGLGFGAAITFGLPAMGIISGLWAASLAKNYGFSNGEQLAALTFGVIVCIMAPSTVYNLSKPIIKICKHKLRRK